MYKQSSFVLALLFASTQAVRQVPVSKSLVGFASGMNGDEDLGQDIKMKGEPFHFEQKAAQTEQKGDDWSANGEPEKVSILQTPIAKTHTTFYGEKPEQAAAQTEKKGDDWSANGEPEKVSILQTPIAKTHTTFYGETDGKDPIHLAQQEKSEDEEVRKPAEDNLV